MDFAYGEAREVARGVRRIVANNPSAMTFKGTNTYLVGKASLAVIDPGPDDGEHIAAILRAAGTAAITHILLTHAHRDHCGAIDRLRALTGADLLSYGRPAAEEGRLVDPSVSPGYLDRDLSPDRLLRDGDTVSGGDWSLQVVHTPGHAPDHLCFRHFEAGALFSGDHVMGWNTSVIAPPEGSMRDYMASLERLLGFDEPLYLPGHGGAVTQPAKVVKAFLVHRRWREDAILQAIRGGATTIDQMMEKVYFGIDDAVKPAAALSLLAHAELLVSRGAVSSEIPLNLESRFSIF